MEITKALFDMMDKMIADEPPETGGILGSKDNTRITDIIFDKPIRSYESCCRYEPNVEFLNKCIAEWADAGIYFKGIFHSHFANVRSLSDSDINYIKKIMNAMPEQINNLYFPVFTLPERELVCYKADRDGSKISIVYEDVFFI